MLATVHPLQAPKYSAVPHVPDTPHAIDVETFFDSARLRRSAWRHRASLRGHSRILGADMLTMRSHLSALVSWGLVTRKSLGMRSDRVELTTRGISSLSWAGPPCPAGEDENRWASELSRCIAADAHAKPHDVLKGRARLARGRLCYALAIEASWHPRRVQMRFGIPEEEVESAARVWLDHVLTR